MSFDDFIMTTWEQENESERKKELQIPRLKLKLFGILMSIVISVKSLLTETTMSIDNKTPNGSSINV